MRRAAGRPGRCDQGWSPAQSPLVPAHHGAPPPGHGRMDVPTVRRRLPAPSTGGNGARCRAVPEGMTTSSPTPKVHKTDEEWRAQLSPEEYAVLRQAGTERPWTGEYVDTKTVGVYECRACGAELFRSETKFDTHCGWPSFYEASAADNVVLREDRSHGMIRTEVLCGTCHSHLGHLFDDAPQTPTGDRYCINSVSIRLQPAEG